MCALAGLQFPSFELGRARVEPIAVQLRSDSPTAHVPSASDRPKPEFPTMNSVEASVIRQTSFPWGDG